MTAIHAAVLQALASSPLAAELSPADCEVLATRVRLHKLAAGQVVGSEGTVDDRLFVVVDGTLSVVKYAGTANETLLTTLRAGDLAHELGFLDGTPRHASLVAAEASQLLELSRVDLDSLVDSHPRILYAVMCAIVRAVHRVQTRLSAQASELTNYVFKQHGRY
ncbi:MAG: cyclic nucleotide-binding domain-containing protein [Ideonella sp.]